MLGPWIASQRAKAALIEAESQAQILELQARAQSSSYQLITDAQTSAREQVDQYDSNLQSRITLSDQIEQSISFQAGKRIANTSDIVRGAAENLGDKDAPDVEPDHDWAARFFDYAQDVSTEEMQALWSKVLAGEVERPGSTSLRALGVLRDLTQDSAGLFAKLCSLASVIVINDGMILDSRVVSLGGNAEDNSLEEYSLSFAALNLLNEHGLITSDYNSWSDYAIFPTNTKNLGRAPTESLWLQHASERWYVYEKSGSRANKKIKIHGVALSNAGIELSRLVDTTQDSKYTAALVRFLSSKGLDLRRIED